MGFRGTAVSEFDGNDSTSMETGPNSLLRDGDADGGPETLRQLFRRPGKQLIQKAPFRTQTQLAHVPDLLHRQQLIPKQTHGYE